MYSSKAASAASGLGADSASTSNAAELAADITGAVGVVAWREICGLCPEWVPRRSAVEAAAHLALSPFRSKPRATRIVPLACSTLIGFVSTRLAPMRNAFATPVCPSTTATESAD